MFVYTATSSVEIGLTVLSSSSSLDKTAVPKVITPIRPTIMVPIMINFPRKDNSPLIPVDNPPVLYAAADSITKLRNGSFSVHVSINTLMNKNKVYNRKVEVAAYKRSDGILLPKIETRERN